ncbi:MAG: hypothetical protein JO067_06585 [Cupriavidus sp.]|nr:hypothetical protein [Cupriavidus sp.]
MASYRDPQLIPTLLDLVRRAANPDRLRVVVCWQHDLDELIGSFFAHGFSTWHVISKDGYTCHNLRLGDAVVELIDVPAMQTRGACWARNLIQQHYEGEAYTLQLDSHHRFVDGWDEILVEMLERLRGESKRPVLTAYLPAFDPECDPASRAQTPLAMHFDSFVAEGAVCFMPGAMPDWASRSRPLPARFYSAHFAFADGHFACNVQHDPEYFFLGEEISISARAFTHGYDLYHPHRLIAWHEYTRKGRTKVWDDHSAGNKEKGLVDMHWCERNDLSFRRNRILFGMDGEEPSTIDFGKFGFGAVRTLAQYEAYAGISFSLRGVKPNVLERCPPVPGSPVPATEDEYRAGLQRSNNFRVAIHRNELGDLQLVETACFEVYGQGIDVLHRYTMSAAQLAASMEGDWLMSKFVFLSAPDAKPARCILRLAGPDGAPLVEIERLL